MDLISQRPEAVRLVNARKARINGLGLTKHLYFTIDCDWVQGSQKGLEALLDCCDRYQLRATVFFAGRFAEAYPDLVRDCHNRGHQLGTHGWAHGGLEEDEDFRTASVEQQRQSGRRRFHFAPVPGPRAREPFTSG